MDRQAEPGRKSAGRRGTLMFMSKTAILAALSVILMYVNFPIIPGFGFLKLDFANLPSLIGGFILNPFAAVVIEVVKILFTLLKTYSMGIGELSNIICSLAFVLPPTLIYRYHRSFKGALSGLAVGIALELLVSALSNYFIIFPMYVKVMGMGFLNGMSLGKVILAVVLPFNIIKTVLVSAITLSVYKPLSKLFRRLG